MQQCGTHGPPSLSTKLRWCTARFILMRYHQTSSMGDMLTKLGCETFQERRAHEESCIVVQSHPSTGRSEQQIVPHPQHSPTCQATCTKESQQSRTIINTHSTHAPSTSGTSCQPQWSNPLTSSCSRQDWLAKAPL